MSVAAPTTAGAESAAPTEAEPTPRAASWPGHLLFTVITLCAAVCVTARLWAQPYGRVLAVNVGDQSFFEWVLSYGVHVLRHGTDPFFTDLMNVPVGVNLAANTTVTVYAVLFAPLTVLAGPQVSMVTILTLNLAGSAVAWYLFLQRWVVSRRLAAAVGGLFCGFAPGFISHANGHLNFTSGWIAPLVLWWTFKLREDGRWRWLRNGAITGLLLAVGFSIAAEALFFTVLAATVFCLVWALSRANWEQARTAAPRVFAALGVAAVAAGTLLGYPLYMHFAGPQTFHGTGFSQRVFEEDLAAYASYSSRTVAAALGLSNEDLASNPTEQTSFFGLPLVVLVVGAMLMLFRQADRRHRVTLRALTAVGLVFFVLSLGPRLKVMGTTYDHLPLPYALLVRAPLFNAALPMRLALVVTCVVGVVLALTVQRLFTTPRMLPTVRAMFAAAIVVCLLPLIPTPLLVRPRDTEPAFIAQGLWKRYVADGAVMSEIPFANNVSSDMMRWQAYTMARGGPQFRIPGGYFLGPGGPNGTGRIGAPMLPTDWMFARAAIFGETPVITDEDKVQARADFQHWNITAVFLPDGITGANGPLDRLAVERVAKALLGEPIRVGDVLLWRIRPGVDPVTPGR